VSLFQSNLRKQIRNLPKILNFVKKFHYFCELFTSLLNQNTSDGCRTMSREACVTQGARRIARVAEFGREGERYEDLAEKLNSRFVIHSKLAASQ